MLKVTCKSLFNGNASIGTHVLQEAKATNQSIMIRHKGLDMEVRPFMFGKFFKMGNKTYPHKSGLGTYTLQYIKFEGKKVEKKEVTNAA